MSFHFDANVFTPDTIRRIIEENQKSTQEERTGPNIAFIPEGRHIIRWFLDPVGKLFREVMLGRVGRKRFVCPDFLARTDKVSGITYPTCELDRLAKERDMWRDKCRYLCIAYGVLYETKNGNEYWKLESEKKPTPFAIIGNSHLKAGLLAMLETLQDNGMDMLLAMLNPTAHGFFSSVAVTKGQQGTVHIQVLPNRVDPVVLDDWYVPLTEVYITNEFDEKTYYEAIAEYVATISGANEGVSGGGSILDEIADETLPITSRPMVTPAEFSDKAFLDADVIELTPRVTTTASKQTTKKQTTIKTVSELPEHITLDMLPDGCPGWGNYTIDLETCALCEVNLDCMAVADAKS